MHHPTGRIAHTTAFGTPVIEHWLEREIAQWVHHGGSIRRPIAPWANALTTEIYLAPLKKRKREKNKEEKFLPVPYSESLFLTRVYWIISQANCLVHLLNWLPYKVVESKYQLNIFIEKTTSFCPKSYLHGTGLQMPHINVVRKKLNYTDMLNTI